MHCIHSEMFQFRCKFFQNLIRQGSPFQHGFVEHGSEFIASHWTIPFEFSIGVTSEHTIAFQSRYIFISPVILRYIWEELELRCIQFLSCIHIQQSRFQTFQFFSEVFDFLRHSYLGSRNMVALAQLQADTRIHHIFTIAEAAAYREHGIFIRTIVSADSGCIFAIVIAIACCEIPLVIRIEVQRVERCQSGCTSTDFVDAVAQFIDTPGILCYLLVGCKELAAIDSVSRCGRNTSNSYTTYFSILVYSYFIIDCNSTILVKFYRGLVIRNSISSDIHICQFSPIICIDFIFCRNRASRFNSAIGSANAYILASDITKKKILIQTYFISLLPVLICFFYGNIATIDYFCMLSCFLFYFCDTISQILHITFNIGNIRFDVCNIPFYLRYSIIGCFQLTTIDSIRRCVRNISSSYTTYFSILVYSYFIIDCNSTILVKFYRGLVIRNSISNDIHICQFSSLICIDFISCRNKASRFNSAIGSANAYILASDITKKKILIQTYFIGLLPVLICFFYGNIATIDYFCMFPSFLLYSMELATIDGIGRVSSNSTCSYTGNLTILVEGNLAVDYGIAILHVDRCALAVNHTCSSCCTIQCHFSIAIADAFDINQILVQLNLNSFNAIFCILAYAYADILVTVEVNIITGFYIFCFGQNTVSSKFPSAVLQLAYVYCISISYTCCYVGDYFIVSIQTALRDVSFTAKANALLSTHEVIAGIYAVNIKISVQFNINKSSKIGFFLAYGNIFIVTAEVNDGTGFNFSRVGDFFPGGKIPACIFSCSLQLCYVYSIGSFTASCYIGNLTSNCIAAYRYSTGICFPGKAVCTFRSKSTNNTGFSISNREGTNCNRLISICFSFRT